jgi:hypothetical protein
MVDASRQIMDLLRRFELASWLSRIPFRAACVVHAGRVAVEGAARRRTCTGMPRPPIDRESIAR